MLRNFLNLIPIYWFGLTVYWISEAFSPEGCKTGIVNIVSHYLFLNGLTPSWWAGFMGGTGYFGVLAIMWILFPLYTKKIDCLKKAVLYGTIAVSVSYIVMQLIKIANGANSFDHSGYLGDWLFYIYRGIYSYSIGCVLYYILKLRCKCSGKIVKISGYCLMAFIILKMMGQGDLFDGLLFISLWCVFIVIAQEEKFVLIDNRIFSFVGRNITELFVAHIVLYYVLVQNQQILEPGTKTMVLLFALSISIAPILKVTISKPFGKLINKLYSVNSNPIFHKKS